MPTGFSVGYRAYMYVRSASYIDLRLLTTITRDALRPYLQLRQALQQLSPARLAQDLQTQLA